MSEEPEVEFRSYTEDALADLHAEQASRERIALAEQKRLTTLDYQKAEFKNKVLKDVKAVFTTILTVVIVLVVLSGAVFGIHYEAKKHYAKEARIDAAWNASCVGASGTLVFGDTDTDQDNKCVFSNGLAALQYPAQYRDGSPSTLIKDHGQWVTACAGAGGITTPVTDYGYSDCVMPNGFSLTNNES